MHSNFQKGSGSGSGIRNNRMHTTYEPRLINTCRGTPCPPVPCECERAACACADQANIYKQETQELKQKTQVLKQKTQELKQKTQELKQETQELKQETRVLKQETKTYKQETNTYKQEAEFWAEASQTSSKQALAELEITNNLTTYYITNLATIQSKNEIIGDSVNLLIAYKSGHTFNSPLLSAEIDSIINEILALKLHV